MRRYAFRLAVALLFSLFCLPFQTAPVAQAAPPWESAKDLIIIIRIQPDGYLLFDPSTIRIVDGYITYQEYKESAAPKDRDIPYRTREIMIDLENRKARISWVKVFGPDGQELGGEAFPDSQWGDIEPNKQIDLSLQEVLNYCYYNNQSVTLPAWYKVSRLPYLGTTAEGDNIFGRTRKDHATKELIGAAVEWTYKNHPVYGYSGEVAVVAFNPVKRKYALIDRELFIGKSRNKLPNTGWIDIVPGSVYDSLFRAVLEYHQQQGWKPSE